MATVYLAGKMTGLSLEEMSGWRKRAAGLLHDHGFNTLNPFEVFKIEIAHKLQTSTREIVDSNKYQIRHSDVVLVELDHADISIGTIGEIVYAKEQGKPVICWGKAEKVINHPWVWEHITAAYNNLEEALVCIIDKYNKSGDKNGL
ncbi:hypothetical protein Dred_1194 [Desulforamulus reducens MI-1]|uniref:Nucleoside 2-deoxyribosyltransferase n=2 Tax=Desulforamulus TaxID=2916693 RepID=A4J3S5_DESRM|nr:hypothetical protein Dred_1194 [Desulforamulus reducens MI-1]